MQNSELYRRGFVVPLTLSAEQSLLANDVEENTKVEFYEIPTSGVFYSLWVKGLFEKINDQLGTMIDDYEGEIIEAISIPLLRKVVEKFEGKVRIDSLEGKVVSELLRLCDIAIENNRALFFIL